MSFIYCVTHDRNVQDCRREGIWDCDYDDGLLIPMSNAEAERQRMAEFLVDNDLLPNMPSGDAAAAAVRPRFDHVLAVGILNDETLRVHCEGCGYGDSLHADEVTSTELAQRESNHRDQVAAAEQGEQER